MDETPDFVEEIEYSKLRFFEVVGRGAFGVVTRAKWNGIDVAVKHIETESEKKAFITELKQLSRVNHPNIVHLYGACTKYPVCLVMEYAEGGSLYNVLHGTGPQPDYHVGHAMSWAYQCAVGVEYLHGMKPKPLIHRDLKPPNLLLIAWGVRLKICDFGTACDAHTHMTNNKGSAAWMAPEVFEGSNYSEKCDVFSWGIILWEVLTRRKPFDEIGGPAFRIMWAVHNGTRPPLIKDCPKPLEVLMTRCWSSNPCERPSVAEVVRIMARLREFFPSGNEALIYPQQDVPEGYGYAASASGVGVPHSSVYDTPPLSNMTGGLTEARGHTIQETVRLVLQKKLVGEAVPVQQPVTPKVKPVVVEADHINWRRTSAPASLAASRESLLDKSSRSSTPSVDLVNKRYSADLSKLEEMEIMAHSGAGPAPSKPPGRGHRRTGSHGNSPLATGSTDGSPSGDHEMARSTTAPDNLADLAHLTSALGQGHSGIPNRSGSWTTGNESVVSTTPGRSYISPDKVALDVDINAMNHQTQPLAPCTTCPESMQIYEEHFQLAQKYFRVQTEVALLTKRQQDLMHELQQDEIEQQDSTRFVEEYTDLMAENEQLQLLYTNIKKQVEMIQTNEPLKYGRL
nr:mitogen-activated protein kinase kinase kinase 7 [Arenicola marina]